MATRSRTSNLTEIALRTEARSQCVEITREVQAALAESGVQSGLCVVYCPHTTAAIAVNENADPNVVGDIARFMAQIIPKDAGFRHAEGNSDSHIKACMFGASATLIVDNGKLLLGRWQGVYFCEFDGPRSRKAFVKIMSD